MNHDYNDKTEPASFLVENAGLLPRGIALDIAMGSGRNAIYLAKMGYSVQGVDISRDAIQEALQTAQRTNVHIQTQVVDLEKDYQIPAETYDVIICFYYLQRSLIPQIKNGLKKNGMVVYETYIAEQAQFGRPHNPDFLLKPNELLDIFRDYRCLRYREGIIENRKAIASLVAQKWK